MRARTLRTVALLTVLALTPALAAARPWGDNGERIERQAASPKAERSFWQELMERITAIWQQEGTAVTPGG